jgi:hypothetical protein
VEVEHQFPGDIVVGVGYFRRETRRNIGAKNVAVPLESYIPLQVTEKNSGRELTVYNQDPELRGKYDVLWDNYDELNSHFNGLDVTVNKRFANRWMIMGGLSVGKNTGDTYGGADLNNPNYTFRRGLEQRDVPVSFKVSGSYEFPYQIMLSGNVQHFTGFPEDTTVRVSSDTVSLTQVSQRVRVDPRGTTRLPDNNLVDLSVRKTFVVGDQASVQAVLELFNLLNANTTQSRITQLGSSYGRVTSIQYPRMLRLGFMLQF